MAGKSERQSIAIALSEARRTARKGEKRPPPYPRKPAKRKPSRKRAESNPFWRLTPEEQRVIERHRSKRKSAKKRTRKPAKKRTRKPAKKRTRKPAKRKR